MNIGGVLLVYKDCLDSGLWSLLSTNSSNSWILLEKHV